MNPPSLIDPEALRASQAKYFAEHPTPQMVLIAHAQAHPELTAKQLGKFVGFGAAWARKVLKQANVPYSGRKLPPKITAATLCKRCSHAKGGARALSLHQESHCEGGWIHIPGHWSNPGSKYICETAHCIPGCDCKGFQKP